MVSAMGNLAEGVAKAMGTTLPNTVDDDFQEITSGEIGQAMNIMQTCMAVVEELLRTCSGLVDGGSTCM